MLISIRYKVDPKIYLQDVEKMQRDKDQVEVMQVGSLSILTSSSLSLSHTHTHTLSLSLSPSIIYLNWVSVQFDIY